MPNKSTDAEAALRKLGQSLRAGMAEKHPAPSLETVRDAVREQYEQEQATERKKTAKPPTKGREPNEPDQDR